MKIKLTALETLEFDMSGGDGTTEYAVEYCGICRTDAKMFYEGQRDLALPRVLGHEAVFRNLSTGKRYVAWPAKCCGTCAYCLAGDENLCDSMRIMGFHFNGGYSTDCPVDGLELIELSSDMEPHLAVFTEPLGCVLNAFRKLEAEAGKRLLIYGAGTLGLLAGILGVHRGLRVTILEKNEEKIRAVSNIREANKIDIVKAEVRGDYDYCVNACADHAAFANGLTKLKKGGTMAFFSGMAKNENLSSDLLNLAHYKELRIHGAYGLTRRDFSEALDFIGSHADSFAPLVQGFVAPLDVGKAFATVIQGVPLKLILDFTAGHKVIDFSQQVLPCPRFPEKPALSEIRTELFIPALDGELRAQAQYKMDNKTKPLGSLGKLEELAVQLCAIKNTLKPKTDSKLMLVFAGDHGITEEGVSAFPQEVTAQMVRNFAAGGAAINVLCAQYGTGLRVIDMGVNAEIEYSEMVLDKKVRKGTRNFALGDAMTGEEATVAVKNGMDAFLEIHGRNPVDILGLGEMGIGNTSSAAMIISMLGGLPVEETAGRGTGMDDPGLAHKIKVLRKALALHSPSPKGGVEILRAVGGFEIAGMAGAALAAASRRVPVVLDGVISTAAGLIAWAIDPRIKDYLIVGHKSVERAQAIACGLLGLEPVLDLSMRLGEGTGAVLAMGLMESAALLLECMASFEDASVSAKL